MQEIVLQPIGYVRTDRDEVKDDYWGSVISVIELDETRFPVDVVAGLSDFSHLEVIFHMNKVNPAKIEMKARHPRNNPDWPLVGIFAQRAKGRPNQLGISRCKIVKVEGLRVTVQALDAIDGTPVLDIKPYLREFGPQGETEQPEWASALMKEYYAD
ncbi:MAG TPA: SAM-dependent methyltransferase [Bacilli bacterium]|nr:SAM-dependent methyltransferase [Bacilli bacterium]